MLIIPCSFPFLSYFFPVRASEGHNIGYKSTGANLYCISYLKLWPNQTQRYKMPSAMAMTMYRYI